MLQETVSWVSGDWQRLNLRLYHRLLKVPPLLLIRAVAIPNTLHVLLRVSLTIWTQRPQIRACSLVRRVLQTPVTSIIVTRNGITALTAMMVSRLLDVEWPYGRVKD
jgi:hypothetical protein